MTLFARASNKELFAVLLEKAFAKFAGSYQALTGGWSCLAWTAMTGQRDLIMWRRDRHQPKWQVIGSKGLLVRAECDLQSDKLGRLGHGAEFAEVEHLLKS